MNGVTFVGGKWYDAQGRAIPKPAPQAQPQGQASLPCYETPNELLERLAACTCAQPQRTGHVPGCLHFADALYVCERGTRETVAQLAKLAETTISDLERRRCDYAPVVAECPTIIPQGDGRRRCARCPYWDRHGVTPFDHQNVEVTP